MQGEFPLCNKVQNRPATVQHCKGKKSQGIPGKALGQRIFLSFNYQLDLGSTQKNNLSQFHGHLIFYYLIFSF